ncbi:MAG TPA: peptidylprolyl isomerase [Candidatus Cloacimonadota bacterium]|nr:peptidylprolyl isomerase [Candidatus Cloacimonadota bacterium]
MRLQRMILVGGLLSVCLGCFGVKTAGGSLRDLVGDKSQGSGDKIVGSINGIMVGLDTYQLTIDKVMENYSGQLGGEITDPQTLIYAQETAWKQLVNRILLQEQISKYGITVTEEDIAREMKNPPTEVLRLEVFQTNGAFDAAKYLLTLNENQEFYNTIREYVIEVIPQKKLQAVIATKVDLSPDNLKAQYFRENSSMNGKAILFKYQDAGRVAVTDAEVRERYEADKETKYRKDQVSGIKYVVIRIEASEADAAKIKQEIDQIYNRILRGEDFYDLAKRYSEDPGSATNGGSLGEFGKGQMVREFEAVAFALKPGEISQPVRTSFGWHIVKCLAKGGTPSEPKVTASHILLKVEPSEATREALIAKAMTIREKAAGKGIEAVAGEYGLELKDSGLISLTDTNIPGLGQISGLRSFMRKAKVGDVSEIERDYERNLIVAQLSEIKPAYYEPFEDAEFKIAFELEKGKKIDLALAKAKEFLVANKTGDLSRAATAAGMEIVTLKNFKYGAVADKIGDSPEFTQAALDLNTGEVSQPVRTPAGAVVIIAGECHKPDQQAFMNDSAKQEEMKGHLSDAAFNKWFEELVQSAEIRDYRFRFGL